MIKLYKLTIQTNNSEDETLFYSVGQVMSLLLKPADSLLVIQFITIEQLIFCATADGTEAFLSNT